MLPRPDKTAQTFVLGPGRDCARMLTVVLDQDETGRIEAVHLLETHGAGEPLRAPALGGQDVSHHVLSPETLARAAALLRDIDPHYYFVCPRHGRYQCADRCPACEADQAAAAALAAETERSETP